MNGSETINISDCDKILYREQENSVTLFFENKKQIRSLIIRLFFKLLKQNSPFNLFIRVHGQTLK